MIAPDVFGVEPWSVPERALHLGLLAQTESIFALSNGHIGLRGNLDEGEPRGVPGTFLNGFYEVRPLPYAEPAYGNPEAGQTMINVTNGKLLRLLVDDEPFDVRYGRLVRHERELDLRAGVLRRVVQWVSPAGQAVVLRCTRLVSFAQRAVAAILYEVQPLGAPARIVVQSALVANEPGLERNEDPRAAAALRSPLISERHHHTALRATLVHRASASGLLMAAGMDHVVGGPPGTVTEAESEPDLARVTVSTELAPRQGLRIVKFLAYGWSSERSLPSLRDQVDAALAGAKRTGQAGARAEGRAIPAKGLTGGGYDGHTFWDMEAYTLPVLTYIAPGTARDALCWRHSTIDLARARARVLGLQGAAFPWRTIRGHECSGYWPAGTAAFHINADIAEAVRRYLTATADEEFERGPGLELLIGTARLWRSIGHRDSQGAFRIDRVTGPDEYTALVDNNVFTSLMAARNLAFAAQVVSRNPVRAAEFGIDQEEIASWRDAVAAIALPVDDELAVTPQNEGFTRYRRWDFEATPPEKYPLLLHFHNYLLYSSQVVKQADLVFALYICGDCFSPEQKARDFDYYERITVRDSSLSASIQAVVAAQVGQLELAYDYLAETSLIDLRDLAFNTGDGVHLAARAGPWLAAVAGFGGLRDYGELLSFAPRLPSKLTSLRFGLLYRGCRLRVEVRSQRASYELTGGTSLTIMHHGEKVTLSSGHPESCPIPPLQARTVAVPPPGQEPPREHREA